MKLNNNMGCIEIYKKHSRDQARNWLNNNMECIEMIARSLFLQQLLVE